MRGSFNLRHPLCYKKQKKNTNKIIMFILFSAVSQIQNFGDAKNLPRDAAFLETASQNEKKKF